MQRASGVLMHISSLGGNYSIGGFGKEAKKFIDYLSSAGFTWWQVLPFCPVDECNSPYKTNGTFGANPYFIDLEVLFQKGLLTEQELEAAKQTQPYSCEFDRLRNERLAILKIAANRVVNRDEIESFISKRPHIQQFCEFMALKEENKQKAWNEWTEQKVNSETMFLWKFIQYEFFNQWSEIKSYANSKGVKIMGDVPIYVSYDSADVWANKQYFMLDENDLPSCVAGVPPDYFCEDGQLWGNPIYDWKRMQEDGFSWWMDRMQYMFDMFDGVRIDHFRAIESYWSVPFDATTARDGKWMRGPGMPFIDKLREIQGDKIILAEDLGIITRDVEKLVEQSGFLSMRVFQFGFTGEHNSPHMPHNYHGKTVAYTGTHDNNTLLGYVWELGEKERLRMLEYCGFYDKDWDNCYDSILRSIYKSHAGIAIFPVQDLLGYGCDTRLNVPGRAENNWGFRVSCEQLESIDWDKFAKWNKLYGRANS